ncbi:MAG: nucleotide exchange factor GrpE [Candidatus Spechtbacteria bacterium]|nr:nucleotide exchange factor GrpE [Candidatus Spechtbacteria bacterium]
MEDMKEEKIEYEPEIPEDAEKKLSKLRWRLAECKKERQEYLYGWQRALADFQNHIKQSAKEMEEFRRFAAIRTIAKILVVLDNLEFAEKSMPEHIKNDVWGKGVLQVKKQFESILKGEGVEKIDPKTGEKFDPSRAETVEEVESKDAHGTIVEVVENGYLLEGKVIKPAKVKVAK